MNLLASGVPLRTNYLVDLGRLVPVEAVNPRSAYWIALTSVGLEPECPARPALVYQIDSEGELIAVYV